MFWWLTCAAVASEGFVFHHGVVQEDEVHWTTTWVGIPETTQGLVYPLPAETRSLPPSKPKHLLRGDDLRVHAFQVESWRISLTVPQPDGAALQVPLWRTDQPQRIVVEPDVLVDMEATGLVRVGGVWSDSTMSRENRVALDRVAKRPPPNAAVMVVALDGELSGPPPNFGVVRRPARWPVGPFWALAAAVAAALGVLTTFRSRRRSSRLGAGLR